ncbi:MAG: hypothetical protein H7Z11_09150 [Verrucomicrobia bacterium]|nr:hypothetical protein [Leptolyngbya sp. ES-bin-22]
MDEPSLYGQVKASIEMTDLLQLFKYAGLQVQIRESSHFTNGCYLMVKYGKSHSCLIFEKIEQDEYLIRADVFEADVICLSELTALAETTSNVFSKSELQHRFEIYDPSDQLVRYFHFNWQHK